MATVLSRNFRQLFLFRAAEGLGETFYFPASTSLISDYHGTDTRSRALGLHQTAVYMGTIGGGYFAGLLAERYGWRLSFVVFGGLGVLLGFVLHRFLIEPPRGASEGRARIDAGSRRSRHRSPIPASGSTSPASSAWPAARRPCSACSARSCAPTSSRSCCCRGCRSSSSIAFTWGWRCRA